MHIVTPGDESIEVLNRSINRVDESFRVHLTELTTKSGWTLRF